MRVLKLSYLWVMLVVRFAVSAAKLLFEPERAREKAGTGGQR